MIKLQKLNKALLFTLIFFSNNIFANVFLPPKFLMSCDVIDYRIQSNLAIPLKPGELRIVDKFMVSFLDSDTYSKSSTSECIGKKDEKVCMSKGNDVYCSNPKPKFMVKSLKKRQFENCSSK